MNWPTGCLKPSTCARRDTCMYVNCPHDGRDIKAEIAQAKSREWADEQARKHNAECEADFKRRRDSHS